MNTQRLKELAADPRLVPVIYAYCDRWCARCAFTDRCLAFRWEAETRNGSNGPAGANGRDGVNGDDRAGRGGATATVGASLEAAAELLQDIADEVDIDPAELEAEAEAAGEGLGFAFPAPDPEGVELVASAAFGYARAVDAWFEGADASLHAKAEELAAAVEAGIPGTDPAAEGSRIHEALEVVRYYQHFIPIKLVRAVSGMRETEDLEEVNEVERDADGSAKVALLAMDRSCDAWRRLRRSLRRQARPIGDLLAHLRRLRRETEARFPEARAFVRPGLDEPEK